MFKLFHCTRSAKATTFSDFPRAAISGAGALLFENCLNYSLAAGVWGFAARLFFPRHKRRNRFLGELEEAIASN
jgi:hypothetical protein